ncbi:MAG: hypothetical protein A3E87_04005 [Gammaproteobacteria bacterium RIFCSPHIGHO2_12_FULL_35_23]|nr:MAG: hypothetical protein A3E87_04005 [Gammaproteobacteria bacterium RIFCSPHIGHO2_12_FULL_35_23]
MTKTTLSIIGLGAAGTSLFAQLIEHLNKNNKHQELVINVFEPSKNLNVGISYCTDSQTSLLNSTVDRTSLFADNLLHFYKWLQKNKLSLIDKYPVLENMTPSSYLPRKLCGLYLQDTFKQYVKIAKELHIVVNLINEEVIDICNDKNKTVIITNTNKQFITNKIILTTGHIYANPYKEFSQYENFFSAPYPESTIINKIKNNSQVLVLGSRLTAIDLALSLLKNDTLDVYLSSRSGCMPMIKAPCEDYQPIYMKLKNIKQEISIEKMLAIIQKEFIHLYKSDEIVANLMKRHYNENDFLNEYAQTIGGSSKWQLLATIFDSFIEQTWEKLGFPERNDFVNKQHAFLTRFTATMPLDSAKLISQYLKSHKIKLISGLKALQRNQNKTFSIITDEEIINNIQFDYAINATGYSHNLKTQSLYANLSKANKLKFNEYNSLNVDANMEVKGHDLGSCQIFSFGPPIFGTKIIVDFLLFIANDAKKVVQNII